VSDGDQVKGEVLVVDDTPAIRRALSDLLRQEGYEVRTAESGSGALAALEEGAPDLILMDVDMPELDGYSACKRLKSDDRFADVPVIFVSANLDAADKIKAFESGGADYVTKPFHVEELMARVGSHLRNHKLQQELDERFRELQALEAAKDSLQGMIVHDLRGPLSGIITSLQLLEIDAAQMGSENVEDVQRALRSSKSLIQMINALLDVTRLESSEFPLDVADGDVAKSVVGALSALGGLLSGHDVVFDDRASPVWTRYDQSIVERVVANLVSNAVKFTPAGGRVSIRVLSLADRVRVEVEDTGQGIPQEFQDKVFDKFARLEAGENVVAYSTGLGLTFCKLAVEAHRGSIGVESVLGEGSTFWFELPSADQATSIGRFPS